MDKFLTHAWFKPPAVAHGGGFIRLKSLKIMNYELPIIIIYQWFQK